MENVVSTHRQLRCVLWIAEIAIIAIALVTAAQIGIEKGGSIWACGPVAIIAIMESMRIPLSGWAAHLRPLAMLGAFVVLAAIACMTFEGMAMAVERFMDQRVIDVVEAREALNDAQEAAKLGLTKTPKLTPATARSTTGSLPRRLNAATRS